MNINYRNPRHTLCGRIDVEIEIKEDRWVVFTADPADSESMGRALHKAILDDAAVGRVTIAPVED
jgi:hypothetical protein